MHYQTLPPHPLLQPFIKFFWVLESYELPVGDSVERILPDGCVELLFNFSDPVFRIHGDGGREEQPRSFIHGQIKNYMQIQAPGRTGMVGARFYPTGLSSFIDLPVSELTNKAVSLQDIFGREAKALEERVLNEPEIYKKVSAIETFLIRKLIAVHRVDYALERCITLLTRTRGQIGLSALSKIIRISERHLERKFSVLVGLSPKTFQRVIRFQHMLRMIQHNKINKLSDLLLESGYYDQAHFTNDFRKFSGINPGNYITSENTLANYFSTDNLFQDQDE